MQGTDEKTPEKMSRNFCLQARGADWDDVHVCSDQLVRLTF